MPVQLAEASRVKIVQATVVTREQQHKRKPGSAPACEQFWHGTQTTDGVPEPSLSAVTHWNPESVRWSVLCLVGERHYFSGWCFFACLYRDKIQL